MRRFLLGLACCAATVSPAIAAPPSTPEGWRAAATQDLAAIHDILRDNSPAMVVTRDSAHFRDWLEEGLRQARAGLAKVSDGRGYYYVLKGYVGGFRDSHIGVRPTPASGVSLRAFAWPGFVLGARDGGYQVAFRSPDAPEAPPPGAELVGCDGKSTQALVAQHDRYDGNFELAAGREAHAAELLLEHGNPFIARPSVCTFRAEGAARSYRLDWRHLDADHAEQVDAAGADPQPRTLGLEPWGERRWWITVPSMAPDQDWTGFYAKVKSHIDAIRAADVVVIDVRGNDGGDSSFGDRLARLLWGEALVDARMPQLGPEVWRVSKLNRDYWAGLVEQFAKDPKYPDSSKAELRSILARYDQALAKDEAMFELADAAPAPRPPAGPNPMHGRVVVLTDSACTSACLDLMDEFTAMPRVVQAGSATSADTIFMELTRVPELPSGLSSLGFGHKAWIKRPRGSNAPYAPSPRFTWTGDKRDAAGLKAWLEQALAGP